MIFKIGLALSFLMLVIHAVGLFEFTVLQMLTPMLLAIGISLVVLVLAFLAVIWGWTKIP